MTEVVDDLTAFLESGLNRARKPPGTVTPTERFAYPRESVIAENFHAMVLLGRANSRMKDFYDIWILSQAHECLGDTLAKALAATFSRRKDIPTERRMHAFAYDPIKVQQWASFVELLGRIQAHCRKSSTTWRPEKPVSFATAFPIRKVSPKDTSSRQGRNKARPCGDTGGGTRKMQIDEN